MWVGGHVQVGWLLAHAAGLRGRDRKLVAWAGEHGSEIIAARAAYDARAEAEQRATRAVS